jgi:hypothetical protein
LNNFNEENFGILRKNNRYKMGSLIENGYLNVLIGILIVLDKENIKINNNNFLYSVIINNNINIINIPKDNIIPFLKLNKYRINVNKIIIRDQ